MHREEKMIFLMKESTHSLLVNHLKNGTTTTTTSGFQTRAVVLLKLFARQQIPRLVFLHKTKGSSQGEVPEDLMLNLRV